MNPETQAALRDAEQVVKRLLKHCGKHGSLYRASPRAVAHVSRRSKWLLNALATLDRELRKWPEVEGQRAS
jgi:hypothetical protein